MWPSCAIKMKSNIVLLAVLVYGLAGQFTANAKDLSDYKIENVLEDLKKGWKNSTFKLEHRVNEPHYNFREIGDGRKKYHLEAFWNGAHVVLYAEQNFTDLRVDDTYLTGTTLHHVSNESTGVSGFYIEAGDVRRMGGSVKLWLASNEADKATLYLGHNATTCRYVRSNDRA
eukprot:424957_1